MDGGLSRVGGCRGAEDPAGSRGTSRAVASGRRGATRVWKSRIFRDRLPKRHAWTKASKPVEFMGHSALPSLTEHLLFHGSCWVPGTKEAPVPRGACSVPLTLNVRKRSSLNLTAGGPLYGPHPSLHPSPPRTGRRPRGLCTSCSGCVHRCSSCTPMLSVNSFLSDFISNVTPPEEASQLLRLNQVVVFCALGPPVFPRFLRQERSSESVGGHGLLPPFIRCPRPRSETPGSRGGDRPSCHGVPRARRRADGL